eukprot:SAG31_NODE_1709_length_7476_cov_25.181254_1_plen_198_part_00
MSPRLAKFSRSQSCWSVRLQNQPGLRVLRLGVFFSQARAPGCWKHPSLPDAEKRRTSNAGWLSIIKVVVRTVDVRMHSTWRQHARNHCTSMVMMIRTVMTSPRSTPDFDNETRPSIDDLVSRGVCHPSAVHTRYSLSDCEGDRRLGVSLSNGLRTRGWHRRARCACLSSATICLQPPCTFRLERRRLRLKLQLQSGP